MFQRWVTRAQAQGLDGPMTKRSDNVKGAAWMTLGMAGYVINDALIKLAADEVPLFQAILMRGICITTVLGIWMLKRGELASLVAIVDRAVAGRVVTEMLATAVYLTALLQLPLAGLSAVIQITPLAVTFAAARLLGEPVSVHRVGAVIVGFFGVLLVVKPWSDNFSPWFILGLVAVGLITIRELTTKRIAPTIPSLAIAFSTAVSITAMGLVVTIVQGWRSPTQSSIGLLFGAAVFLTIGYLASVITVRVGDLSFSAPFRYSVLLFAIGLQIVVFGDIPDVLTFVGSGVIVAAGVWMFLRERSVPDPDIDRQLSTI